MPPEPRLATHMLVSALIRQCAEQGDFATVVRKGDREAGNLLLLTREKGRNPALYERFLGLDGQRKWQAAFDQAIEDETKIEEYLAKRSARDPDLWILELDVAFAERLTVILGQHS
jgi:hypothetical protein